MTIREIKELPPELKDEQEVFEQLIVKLMVVLNLSHQDWNEKVAPIMRDFLEWHKNYKKTP